jgi:pimeloyl-ACP methyl ester carboxylesterase
MLLMAMLPQNALALEKTGGVSTEERWLERDGQKIYGRLYLPEKTDAPLPLVILSHGLGSNHTKMEPYAESFAENGCAAFVFDYIGGAEKSMSDGSMTDMSVLTEAEDLFCVLDAFRGDARFSEDEIFLFGESQGGFISAYAAGKRPDEIAGLVLLYPALNLQDICRELVSDEGEIPDSAVIGKHTVGGIYVRDMLSFDIYEVLGQYSGPVLLFHGTADPYVPLAYTQRAQQTLADTRTVIVEGAGHGFYGEDRERVERESAAFVQGIAAESGQDMRAAA